MSNTEQSSEPADLIRDAIRRAVEWLGYKRGIHAAAQAIGIHERVAKGARYGEAVAFTEDRAERAFEFRRQLAQERAARLRAELVECERIAGTYENTSAAARVGHSLGIGARA